MEYVVEYKPIRKRMFFKTVMEDISASSEEQAIQKCQKLMEKGDVIIRVITKTEFLKEHGIVDGVSKTPTIKWGKGLPEVNK